MYCIDGYSSKSARDMLPEVPWRCHFSSCGWTCHCSPQPTCAGEGWWLWHSGKTQPKMSLLFFFFFFFFFFFIIFFFFFFFFSLSLSLSLKHYFLFPPSFSLSLTLFLSLFPSLRLLSLQHTRARTHSLHISHTLFTFSHNGHGSAGQCVVRSDPAIGSWPLSSNAPPRRLDLPRTKQAACGSSRQARAKQKKKRQQQMLERTTWLPAAGETPPQISSPSSV